MLEFGFFMSTVPLQWIFYHPLAGLPGCQGYNCPDTGTHKPFACVVPDADLDGDADLPETVFVPDRAGGNGVDQSVAIDFF